MKGRTLSLSRSAAASLSAGLLCCLPTSNQHAQIVVGSTTATALQGQAASVSGIAAGSFVSVANVGPLGVTGGALEAAALETSVAPYRGGTGRHWQDSEPSLEDVFIDLMGRARDNFQG